MTGRRSRWACRAATLAAMGMAVIGCREPPRKPTMDFGAPASLQGLTWACHTTFATGTDTAARRDYLEVTVHAGVDAKMEWDWLNGDWRAYDSLCFDAETVVSDSLDFHLTVWDGIGNYGPENRIRRDFILGPGWKTRCLDLADQTTSSGRRLDRSRIRRVVFFSDDIRRPLRFRLDGVVLRRLSFPP